MATLYYGNGEVNIEGSGIRGVEIRYKGSITIEDKTSPSFAIAHQNNGILIFPIGEGSVNELFSYNGELNIISVIVADMNGEKVSTTIKRVMDYSELLGTNAEDMTNLSENLSVGHTSGYKPAKTTLNQPIIPNLHTSVHLGDKYGRLYNQDGTEYKGKFHIHLDNGMAMTGSEHGDDSEELYYMKGVRPSRNSKVVPTLTSTKSAGIPLKKKGSRVTRSKTAKGGY